MQLQSLLSFISLLSASLAAPHVHVHREQALASRQVPSKPCSHSTGGVHIIGAPGAGAANPPYGLIDSLRVSLMKAIPGSSNVSLPYNHNEPNGKYQTGNGTITLRNYIYDYHKACPTTKILLIGYSSGAIMDLNAVCGEPPSYEHPTPPLLGQDYGPTVIGAAIYGDETRSQNAPYNKGTCTGTGAHPRASPANQCAKGWAARFQSYCDSDDPLCCVQTGTDPNNHYAYPARYDKIATQFLVGQVKKFGI